jgi:phenylacetate-coenzyme A ligase PaaK-like adenylate-forming protein
MTPAAAYAEASRVALDRALRELPAYAPWRALDPGADMDIDSRYVAMPALTKADIRQACPHDFVPRLHDFAAGLASGTVALVATSGTTETGYVFMQCEHGCFHQNTAFCRVDVVPCAATQDDPLLGRMLVTPFHNPWCQYVRFDVGDIVRLRRDGRCPCGRDHGLIADAIEGRVKNLTTTCSGWAVTEAQVDAALAHCPGIFDYQLQQQAAGLYTLVLQCDSAAPPDVGAQAHAAMRGVYGAQAQIEVRCVAELEPSPSGKFRRVVPAADCSRDR